MTGKLPILAAVAALAAGPAAAQADAERRAYGKCIACHTLDGVGASRYGPDLRGVMGRQAGTNPQFKHFSPAMKASKVVWTAKTLDAFLASPATFIRGNRMVSPPIKDPAERQAIIRYLQRHR